MKMPSNINLKCFNKKAQNCSSYTKCRKIETYETNTIYTKSS